MRIPFSVLRFSNDIEIIMGINLNRYIQRKNELMSWVVYPRGKAGIASKFGHNNGGFFKKFLQFGQKLQAISVMEGAKASTFLATSSDAIHINGKYIDEDCSEKKSSPLSYNIDLQNKLWDESKSLIQSIIKK